VGGHEAVGQQLFKAGADFGQTSVWPAKTGMLVIDIVGMVVNKEQ
jgi:hypothetical protein